MINTFMLNINKKFSTNFNANNVISGGQNSILSSQINLNINRQSFQVSIGGRDYKFCESIKK